MTERLYYENQYINEFEAEIISSAESKGKYEIILDKTAFFPEGGGQPGDRGFIGEARVIDTVERDGEIYHICDRAVSGKVKCKLDWDFRFLNMQQHTGEHIFSGILHQLTGFDNVGFHMGETEVTVDFNGVVTPEQLTEIEDRANDAIYRSIQVETLYPSRDELKNYDYRSKKEIEGQVRLVRIEGVDLCACCGTHTATTSEVGIVKATSCMNYKQGVRISLQIGKKALLDYREKNKRVAEISALLCKKTSEVTEGVEKLKEKNAELNYQLNEAVKKLLSLRCEGVTEDFPAVFDESGNAENARILADILKDKLNVAFAFSGNDETGYKYSVASKNTDVREISKNLNSALNGRGGGKPEMTMGSLSASREEIEKYIDSIRKEKLS